MKWWLFPCSALLLALGVPAARGEIILHFHGEFYDGTHAYTGKVDIDLNGAACSTCGGACHAEKSFSVDAFGPHNGQTSGYDGTIPCTSFCYNAPGPQGGWVATAHAGMPFSVSGSGTFSVSPGTYACNGTVLNVDVYAPGSYCNSPVNVTAHWDGAAPHAAGVVANIIVGGILVQVQCDANGCNSGNVPAALLTATGGGGPYSVEGGVAGGSWAICGVAGQRYQTSVTSGSLPSTVECGGSVNLAIHSNCIDPSSPTPTPSPSPSASVAPSPSTTPVITPPPTPGPSIFEPTPWPFASPGSTPTTRNVGGGGVGSDVVIDNPKDIYQPIVDALTDGSGLEGNSFGGVDTSERGHMDDLQGELDRIGGAVTEGPAEGADSMRSAVTDNPAVSLWSSASFGSVSELPISLGGFAPWMPQGNVPVPSWATSGRTAILWVMWGLWWWLCLQSIMTLKAGK